MTDVIDGISNSSDPAHTGESVTKDSLACIGIGGGAGITRAGLLLRGALSVSALLGASAVAPFVSEAFAQTPAGGDSDTDILRLALTLEYLEATFYDRAQQLHLDADARQLAQLLGGHEHQHVSKLEQVILSLGGTVITERQLQFNFPMHDQRSFLDLAVKLEETGVSAYNGAPVAPHAFDQTITLQDAVSAASPYLARL